MHVPMFSISMKSTKTGVRRNICIIVILKITFKRNIPNTVNRILDIRDAIVKWNKELFFVIYFTSNGREMSKIKDSDSIDIFSLLLQLFHRFKNISIFIFL